MQLGDRPRSRVPAHISETVLPEKLSQDWVRRQIAYVLLIKTHPNRVFWVQHQNVLCQTWVPGCRLLRHLHASGATMAAGSGLDSGTVPSTLLGSNCKSPNLGCKANFNILQTRSGRQV